MRTCAITLTRNECDIIESFVRGNAHLIDRFYFLDDSTDHTPLIISKLGAEGFPVEIFKSGFPEFRQEVMTTSAIRELTTLNSYDWFLILDADEFLTWNRRDDFESALALVPSRHCASIRWSTFVPQSLDYFELANPIFENFRPRLPEVSAFGKIFVPKELAKEVKMPVGNHNALFGDDRPVDAFALPRPLAHVPVRSSSQIILKAIIATRVLEMKIDRHRQEGFHIINVLNMLRENNFEVDLPLLKEIAFGYAIDDPQSVPTSVDPAVAIGGEHMRLRYPELSKINLLAVLDNQISLFSQRVLSLQKAARQVSADLERI
jgi:Glycosyl transferase family 2